MQSGAYRDMSVPRPGKNLVLAYVLWLFFGIIGAHRFYLGHVKAGLLFLIGAAIATGLSVSMVLVLQYVAGAIGLALVVFWIIDAIKMPKYVAAAGGTTGATNE